MAARESPSPTAWPAKPPDVSGQGKWRNEHSTSPTPARSMPCESRQSPARLSRSLFAALSPLGLAASLWVAAPLTRRLRRSTGIVVPRGTFAASCDLASQGSSLRSSGNPTPVARAHSHFARQSRCNRPLRVVATRGEANTPSASECRAAAGAGVLRLEHGMPAHRRLLPVVRRVRGSEARSDEVLAMGADRLQPLVGDVLPIRFRKMEATDS